MEEAARYLFAPWARSWRTSSPLSPLRHRVRLYPGADPKVLPPGLGALVDWREARGFDPKLLDLLREAGMLEEELAFREARGCWCP